MARFNGMLSMLTAAAIALSAGLAAGPAAADDDAIARIKEQGTLRVALTPTALGFNYKKPDSNELVGINVEMAKILADRLGVELEFIEMPFSAVFEHLLSGRSDIVMTAVLIRPERQQMFNFSDVNYSFGFTAITRADDPREFKNLAEVVEEFKRGDLKVGEQTNAAFVNMVREAGIPTTQIQFYDSKQDAIRDLALGRIDITFWDKPIAEYFVHINPDLSEKIRIHDGFESPRLNNGYPIKFEDTELLEFVNEVLAEKKADGTMRQIVESFGIDPEILEQ